MIVLDLMLPRMSGWDFLGQVRENEDRRDIPVIILSVRSGREDRDRGREYGVAHYMTKPFIPADLQSVARKILDLDTTES